MFSLTRKTEYALIAMWHLARADGEVCSARDVAERYGIPVTLLMNVLKTLQRKGLVKSTRGANGGYTLATSADQVSLERLIETVEGPFRLVRCADDPRTAAGDGQSEAHAIDAGPCDLAGTCPIQHPLRRLHERLRRFLAGVTVADLALDDRYAEITTSYPLQRASVE
ncbi:MAG: Rrf2 family transcriptional regulator [Phycisphaerae bacterium]